jgi:hypothetical protein
MRIPTSVHVVVVKPFVDMAETVSTAAMRQALGNEGKSFDVTVIKSNGTAKARITAPKKGF